MKIVLGDIKYDVQFFKKEKNVKLFEVCQDKGDHLWRLGVYAGKDEKEAAEIASLENMTEIKIMVEVSNEDGGSWQMELDLEVCCQDFTSLSIDEGYVMLSNIAQIELDRLEKIDKWTLQSIIDFAMPRKI